MPQMDLFNSINNSPLFTAGFFLNGENKKQKEHEDTGNLLSGIEELFELSIDAHNAALFALMSGFPIMEEVSRFIKKTLKAKDRNEAAKISLDRGDPDVLIVLKTAGKVQHEIHRLQGLLRFNPDKNGVYIAKCQPDYFILPALAEHFTLRFGETSWAIIDEKRELCLYREKGGEVLLVTQKEFLKNAPRNKAKDENNDSWENLWQLYHRTINNEGRKNLRLQRQFMPERYRKYLPEVEK